MEYEIRTEEVMKVMQTRFPKELEICVQQVQIEKLTQTLQGDGVSDDTEES